MQEPQSQGDFAQSSCVAAPSCKELQCNPGYTCIDFDNDREDGGDVGSGFLSPVLQSTGIPSDLVTAVCIANSTRANCEDFPCEEDQVCSLQRYPSRSISLVTCPQGVYPQPPIVVTILNWRRVLVHCVWIWYMQLGRQASVIYLC